MLTLVFMKSLADMALYYTFAGFFGVLLGGTEAVFLFALFIGSFAFSASYLLRDKGFWRFCPLILLTAAYIPARGCLADLIVITPPAMFLLYEAAARIYEPEWEQQINIFGVYWKVLLALVLLGTLFGAKDALKASAVPFAVVSLLCSVLIMRSLRHDPDVYCRKSYQLSNLAIVASAGIAAALLSSRGFLSVCGAVLKTVYEYVIAPIIMGLVFLLMQLIKLIAALLAWLKVAPPEAADDFNLNLQSASESLGIEETVQNGDAFEKIIIALGAVAAALIVFFIFKALAKRAGFGGKKDSYSESRSYVQPESVQAFAGGDAVEKVRAQYRKFLRLLSRRGTEIRQYETSYEIGVSSQGLFENTDAVDEMREIYIRARYAGQADSEDARRARELLGEIKKAGE